MLKIAFRADGGPGIGVGHIIRCLALANEFRRMGHKVLFYSRLEQGIQRIKQEGFEVIGLNLSTSDNMDRDDFLVEEEKELANSIKNNNIDYLIIDSYKVNKEYFENLKNRVKKLIYIDDINKFPYPVDVLINYNINADQLGYGTTQKNQMRLLGTKYVLIRNQFQNILPRQISKKTDEVMITSGGANLYGMCERILKIVLNTEEIKEKRINVIMGSSFENIKEIEKIAEINPNIILYRNIEDISKIMLQSDVAISAGGSTLYELCACGTPTITYIVADNQEGLVNCMKNRNYITSLGWYNKFTDKDLRDKLVILAEDFDRRNELSSKMRELVDGNGARRTAEAILKGGPPYSS